jgi:hypothetical protein
MNRPRFDFARVGPVLCLRCLSSSLVPRVQPRTESISSTTMTPPSPSKKAWKKSLRRIVNRALGAVSRPRSAALPGTSTANVPNDAPGVVRDRSHGPILSSPSQCSSALPQAAAHSAYQVGETPGVEGNRSQDTILPTCGPSSQQCFSHPEPNTSDKLKNAWSVTWSGLETALRLLAKSADAFPPLKSAVGGLVACLDLAQVGCRYGFNDLYLD